MYEESSRMPFVISYPNKIPKSKRIDDLIINLDIPSLILDYAGIPAPASFQGISFRNALETNQESNSREFIYYRYWEHSEVRPAHLGIRSKKRKLIYFYGDGLNKKNAGKIKTKKTWEFYDLEQDPKELKNEFDNPIYRDEIIKLREELVKLKILVKDTETNVPKINKI
jgi:arylsulfatase A-like enzyme